MFPVHLDSMRRTAVVPFRSTGLPGLSDLSHRTRLSRILPY
ncbi:hypothetical protein C7S15_7797 [Burkholderia cepacia]|nr:hypothetical protein [Burkholderia cepacia]